MMTSFSTIHVNREWQGNVVGTEEMRCSAMHNSTKIINQSKNKYCDLHVHAGDDIRRMQIHWGSSESESRPTPQGLLGTKTQHLNPSKHAQCENQHLVEE